MKENIESIRTVLGLVMKIKGPLSAAIIDLDTITVIEA